LIRGEVLRRYPNTIVYANKARIERGDFLFNVDPAWQSDLEGKALSDDFRKAFRDNGIPLSERIVIAADTEDDGSVIWWIRDRGTDQTYRVEKTNDTLLEVYGTKRELAGEQIFPVFEGTMKADISYFAFKLSEAEARGDTDDGWFFLLQEQPTELRFGLDVAQVASAPDDDGNSPTWRDLSWGQLEDSENLIYIDLEKNKPGIEVEDSPAKWNLETEDGSTASDFAFITFQRPFRVAIHASDMLPPPEEEGNSND